ncbi:mercuric reductase [Noviherbaspirillum sp.]|uniref:mercuric reductase n=1 Tax=Noviherbaspirillum sp. TaxID=1926288 RepID=UPI002B4767CC|nr:mercuric reductase [Noviherbaspirillum sp.]HJV79902.1 mercuric reductase [Noviherbaspirillum sp.]HJW05225.1 mercuric reductase [Rhodanobacter sp.]
MAELQRYDALVLGSGESGKYLAWAMAKAGRRVAVIERRWIGGSCPNIACLPSKNIIYSAHIAALCHRGAEFGIIAGPVGIDMEMVRQRKRKMVEDLIAIHRNNYATSGAELIMGEGRFTAPKTIEVRLQDGDTRLLAGERIYLNTGTRAAIPDVPGLQQSNPLTHIEALELDYIPEHLIVLGGGYVGLEFAQPMRRFGCRVTVVEQGPQIAGHEDGDVAQALMKRFEEDGIDVMLNTRPTRVEGRSGDKVHFQVDSAAGTQTIEGSDILVAAGRIPNTEGIGLDIAGIDLDARGYIKVNERLETSAPDVWAMGECAGSPQFTHVAFDDFRVVRDNMHGGDRTTRDRLVPYCMFTDPELGRVGLNESAARRAGIAYRVARIPMAAVLRTRTISATEGFMKALIAADSDRILGFTALGAGAGELIAVVQTAMLAKLPYTALRDAILTHPTIAEGLTVLFANEPVLPDKAH